MSVLSKINFKNFFTKEEMAVLLFLIFFTLLGFAIKTYRSINQVQDDKIQFEKTDIDSILVAVFSDEKVEKSEIIQTKKKEEPLKKKSIDLNKATVEELTRLPGIGEKTAMKIVDYRKKYGGFRRIEEIMNIERIGPKVFEKIKDYLIITK
jgi:comEA protein